MKQTIQFQCSLFDVYFWMRNKWLGSTAWMMNESHHLNGKEYSNFFRAWIGWMRFIDQSTTNWLYSFETLDQPLEYLHFIHSWNECSIFIWSKLQNLLTNVKTDAKHFISINIISCTKDSVCFRQNDEEKEGKKTSRQKVESKGTIESKHWVTLISIWESNDDAKTFVSSCHPNVKTYFVHSHWLLCTYAHLFVSRMEWNSFAKSSFRPLELGCIERTEQQQRKNKQYLITNSIAAMSKRAKRKKIDTGQK